MGSFSLIHYQMSPYTQNQLQGQCNLLMEEDRKGSLMKARLLGRVALVSTCVLLHAEFFVRCFLMLGLALVNCVVNFRREEIVLQGRQAYTALCVSALCFRVLFQPNMLRKLEKWLSDQLLQASHSEPPRLDQIPQLKQIEYSSFASNPLVLQENALTCAYPGSQIPNPIGFGYGVPLSLNLEDPLFPSEQTKVDQAKALERKIRNADEQSIQYQDPEAASQSMKQIRETALQSTGASPVVNSVDIKQKTLSALRDVGFSDSESLISGMRLASAFYKKDSRSEIQTLSTEITVKSRKNIHRFSLIGLFEPVEGARASLYLKNRLSDVLATELEKLGSRVENFDDGLILTACRRAYAVLQTEFVYSHSGKKLHPYLPSLSEDCSAMTVLLMNQDAIYVFNVGNSKAVLNNGGTCVPLSLPADLSISENRKLVEGRGGIIRDGKVNGKISSATIFGGESLHGAVSPLYSVTKILRSEVAPNSHILLGTSSLFAHLHPRKAVEFLHNRNKSSDYTLHADNFVYSVTEQSKQEDVGCLVLCLDEARPVLYKSPASSVLSGMSRITVRTQGMGSVFFQPIHLNAGYPASEPSYSPKSGLSEPLSFLSDLNLDENAGEFAFPPKPPSIPGEMTPDLGMSPDSRPASAPGANFELVDRLNARTPDSVQSENPTGATAPPTSRTGLFSWWSSTSSSSAAANEQNHNEVSFLQQERSNEEQLNETFPAQQGGGNLCVQNPTGTKDLAEELEVRSLPSSDASYDRMSDLSELNQ